VIPLAFEPLRLEDAADMIALALANTDPRVAAYAVGPPASARRARLKGWVAGLPVVGRRVAQPERWFWIVSEGRRGGFVRLGLEGARMHLELVVLDRALQGTGAADRVLAFVEEQASRAGCASIALFVDRRNYRAFRLYLRGGYRALPDRRFVFQVPRSSAPSPRALASLPRHAVAELLGSCSSRGLTFEQGGVAVLADPPAQAGAEVSGAELRARVEGVFRRTMARAVRVTVASPTNVPGGHLVAVLHRMEKVLA
jgi:GNAT superfamily N-acetyltransferase